MDLSKANTDTVKQIGGGLSAEVTGDGRVDIRVSESTTKLEKLLERYLKTIQAHDSGFFEKSSIGNGGTSSKLPRGKEAPVSLNIVIQVVGSRGDVQPFVALGRVLMNVHKHRIRLATHSVFREFVEENGLEFFNIGGDPSELMAFMVKNPGLMPDKKTLKEGQIGQRRKMMMEILQRSWRACFERGNGIDDESSRITSEVFVADAIIANPPSFGHIHCAERLGIPLHMMFTMPWSPTQSFPQPLSNVKSSNVDGGLTNILTYTLVELLTWQGLGDLVNNFREITLGLPPLTTITGPGALHRLKIPYTYCWSPALVPKPKDWSTHIDVVGFYFLAQHSSYQPPQDLQSFLDAGPPPLYIGFGSIVVDDPNGLTSLIFEAVRRTGQRALVSKGWGGLGSGSLTESSSIFMLGNIPHDWLFSRVSCVVHHGGAGTTAAGIAAGKPTVVVPFFGDQPFWGSMVWKAGAGPSPIPFSELTATKLATSIEEALQLEVTTKAEQLAQMIKEEDGCVDGAQSFHRNLQWNNITCCVATDQKAAWTIKNSSTILSPLAASLLLEEGEIHMENLQLLRPLDLKSARRPTDPLSEGAAALMGSISSFMGGLSDIPTEPFSRSSNDTMNSGAGRRGDLSRTEKDSGQEAEIEHQSSAFDLQTGLDVGRGAARAIGAGIRSPADFTLALARGFRNLPRLYGDSTVREEPEVTNLKSGVRAATLGLGQGFFDGISGLIRLPSVGARENGMDGFMKGVGKAIGGVILKPAAGIWGVPGYLSEGFWQEIRLRISTRSDAEIVASRILEGRRALQALTIVDRKGMMKKWRQIMPHLPSNPMKTQEHQDHSKSTRKKNMEDDIEAAVNNVYQGAEVRDSYVLDAVKEQMFTDEGSWQSYRADDTASSIFSTSTQGLAETASITGRPSQELPQTNSSNRSQADDPGIDSDDDENIRRALAMSTESLHN